MGKTEIERKIRKENERKENERREERMREDGRKESIPRDNDLTLNQNTGLNVFKSEPLKD